MRKNKIVMFGILLIALSMSVEIVSADVTWDWEGKIWTETLTGAYLDPINYPGYLIMYNFATEDNYAARLSYTSNGIASAPWSTFSFQTPTDMGTPEQPTQIEFYFSNSANKFLTVNLNAYTLSYDARNEAGTDTDGSVDATGLWKSGTTSNVFTIGIRPIADGGYLDILFNDYKVFTLEDSSFAYEGVSVLTGNAHVLSRSDAQNVQVFWTNFDESDGVDPGYSYTIRNPTIDSMTTTSVNEKTSFELEGTFSDDDLWETWSAVIDWDEGAPETFNDISLGDFPSTFNHLYSNDGVYSGTITITDNEGGTTGAQPFTATITDANPILTTYTYTSSVAGSDHIVTITDITVNASPDTIVGYSWKEGVTELSTIELPSLIFNDLNPHEIILTVTDSGGSSSSVTQTVSPTAPTATLDATPADADISDPVTITGDFVHDGYSLSSVEYDFGDGTVEAGSTNGATFSGTHTYNTPNTYTVEVTVTSSSGQTATDSRTITINAKPPAVTFKAPSITIDEGDLQDFDLSLVDVTKYSASPTYTWKVTDPGASVTTHNGESFSSTYLEHGTYSVELKIEENGLSDTDTMNLFVSNIAPQVDLGANIYEIPLGTLVDFTTTVTDEGEDLDSITFQIEGDPTVYAPDQINYESDPYQEIGFFKHTFNLLGSFAVSSTATDDTTSVTSSITVTVVGVPLELEAIVAYPVLIEELDSATFRSRITGTDLGQTYTVEWYLDDVLVETILDVGVDETISYTKTYLQDAPFKLELKISGTSLTQTYVGYVDNMSPVITIDDISRLSVPDIRTLSGHIYDAEDHPFTYGWYVRGVYIEGGSLADGYDLSFTYDFSSSGSYLVELRVMDNDASGDYTGSGTENVRVNYKPTIDSVSASPDPAYQWSPVDFTVVAHDQDGDSLDYYWEFGDGETSTTQNPTHTYSVYGTMNVRIRVKDSMDISKWGSLTLDVQPLSVSIDPIVSDLDPIYEGNTTTFSSSISAEDHNQEYTVEWILNGVVESTLNNVPIDEPIVFTYTFPQDGAYSLELVVVEASTSEVYDFEVNNVAPIVTLDPMGPLLYLGDVVFIATVEDVDADHPFTYSLTLDSGEVYSGSLSTGFIIEVPHTFTVGGEYEAEIKVYDSSGEEGEDLIMIIVNNPPIINSVTYTPEIVTQGDTVQFTLDVYDPDEEALTYAWVFGNGETSTDQNPSTVYNTYGVYTVTVSVTDEVSAVVSYTLELEVDPDMILPAVLKERAIELLEDAIDEYGDKGKAKGLPKKDKNYVKSSKDIKKSLEKIIREIEKSLEDEVWNDELHLDVKDGHDVFTHEGHAESKADTFARKWADNPELDGLSEILYEVIDLLVEADRALAKVVLDEANQVELPPGSNYDHYLEKAQEHYLKGREYTLEGNTNKAIDEFKKSWKYSVKILDKFPHPHWGAEGWEWEGDWDEWYDWDWDDIDDDSDANPNVFYTEDELEAFSKKELEKLAKDLGIKVKKRDDKEAIIEAILEAYEDD